MKILATDLDDQAAAPWTVDLYWIPLGVGTSLVRLSGRTYEATKAARERRPRRRLFHSALVAATPEGLVTIEMAAVPADSSPAERGAVASGPVGTAWLGRFRVFRYEIRSWPDGVIPDLGSAVASPVPLSSDPVVVGDLLRLVPEVPTPVWGRDELDTGEMWNSNSVVSWILTRVGIADRAGPPPDGGRAPGWHAGVTVAARAVGAGVHERTGHRQRTA